MLSDVLDEDGEKRGEVCFFLVFGILIELFPLHFLLYCNKKYEDEQEDLNSVFLLSVMAAVRS
jgi:hypothetical protein